jgi:hypothetical protein
MLERCIVILSSPVIVTKSFAWTHSDCQSTNGASAEAPASTRYRKSEEGRQGEAERYSYVYFYDI